MSAFVDTNVLVRHLTGDPAGMAARATAFLEIGSDLLVTDLVVAETVDVRESFYEAPRDIERIEPPGGRHRDPGR